MAKKQIANKWEDTRLSVEKLTDLYWPPDDKAHGLIAVANAQAKATWDIAFEAGAKARQEGRKEVVDWIKDNGYIIPKYKLKEWGIE